MKAFKINAIQNQSLKLFADIAKKSSKNNYGRPYLHKVWVDNDTVVVTDGKILAYAPLSYFGLEDAGIGNGFLSITKDLVTYEEAELKNQPNYQRVVPTDVVNVGKYDLGSKRFGIELSRILLDSTTPIDVDYLMMTKSIASNVDVSRNTSNTILKLVAGPLVVIIMGYSPPED